MVHRAVLNAVGFFFAGELKGAFLFAGSVQEWTPGAAGRSIRGAFVSFSRVVSTVFLRVERGILSALLGRRWGITDL